MNFIGIDIGEKQVVVFKLDEELDPIFINRGRLKNIPGNVPEKISKILSKRIAKNAEITLKNFHDKIEMVLTDVVDSDSVILISSLGSVYGAERALIQITKHAGKVYDVLKGIPNKGFKGMYPDQLKDYVDLNCWNKEKIWKRFTELESPNLKWIQELGPPTRHNYLQSIAFAYFLATYIKSVCEGENIDTHKRVQYT